MLNYNAVFPVALEILGMLMRIPELDKFYLVGGAALSLQTGKRISFDIDLFSENSFNNQYMLSVLQDKFPLKVIDIKENTLNLMIKDCKTDIITYKYPLLRPIIYENGLRIISVEDISAMKLAAIGNRGSKKDFFDIYFILQKYSIEQILSFFKEKFNTTQTYFIIRSMTYFEDAEKDPNPILIETVSWTEVKNFFLKLLRSEDQKAHIV
ncbi:MAG: nucleotidyl transferase AbiEii/AbiGii toxin family protein [Bacteroidota bacterium]|nr:nucleotidyl transferase AbiEii/AbiGii toxin family protein [Bacteroidota bacterium]